MCNELSSSSSNDPFTSVGDSRHIAKEIQSTCRELNDRNQFLFAEFRHLIDVIRYRCDFYKSYEFQESYEYNAV